MIRTISDNINILRFDVSPFDLNLPVRFVGCDDNIGHPQSALFQELKGLGNNSFGGSVSRLVKLGTEIMMIEYKLLPKGFIQSRDEKKRVGRIMGMDDVKSTYCRDIETQHITSTGKIDVFAGICRKELYHEQDTPQSRGNPCLCFLK